MAFLTSLAFTSPHAAPALPNSLPRAPCEMSKLADRERLSEPPAEHATPRSVISWVQRRLSLHSGQLHGSPSGFHSKSQIISCLLPLSLCPQPAFLFTTPRTAATTRAGQISFAAMHQNSNCPIPLWLGVASAGCPAVAAPCPKTETLNLTR
jgi:hypothetical protein